MTYTTFRTLYTNAVECTTLSDYIHQNEKAIEDEFGKESQHLLKAVWELTEDHSVACLLRLLGCTQSSFAHAYDIPLRTIENWATKKAIIKEYFVDLLAADALTQKFAQNT